MKMEKCASYFTTYRFLNLFNGSLVNNEELVLNPFPLVISHETSASYKVLFFIERAHDHSCEQVQKEEVANDHEEHKE